MIKILVIDDDESILDAVAMVLEDAGYAVETICKDKETLKRIAAYKPNVILLDMLLSGKDGRQLCRTLKADAQTKQIPVIMISAHPNAEPSARASGADEFLAKPFEREALLQAIAEFV